MSNYTLTRDTEKNNLIINFVDGIYKGRTAISNSYNLSNFPRVDFDIELDDEFKDDVDFIEEIKNIIQTEVNNTLSKMIELLNKTVSEVFDRILSEKLSMKVTDSFNKCSDKGYTIQFDPKLDTNDLFNDGNIVEKIYSQSLSRQLFISNNKEKIGVIPENYEKIKEILIKN